MPGYGLNEATADFFLLLVVGVNCYLGWHYGLVRRVVAVAAVYAGTIAAWFVGNPLASTLGFGGLIANAWGFVAVFAIVVVMVEILASLYADVLRRLIVVMFDRATGVVAGLLVGVLELGVLFLVAQAVAGAPPPATSSGTPANQTTVAVAVDNGVLTQFVVDLEPGLQRLLSPVIPGNLEKRLDS